MTLVIKPMETDEEVRGKALVHWRCWQEVYRGMISQDYLDNFTLEKCTERAFAWRDNFIVAKEDDHVVGFVGYGASTGITDMGEIYALYVLPEYWGQGIGTTLLQTAMRQLDQYPTVCLWALKENTNAIHFYEKYGFRRDGEEQLRTSINALGIRMVLRR